MKSLHIRPIRARQIRPFVQGAALLAFVALFGMTTSLNPLPGLADLFYRLDPLVALTSMLAGRVLIAGLALSLVTVVSGLLFGRAWCGWICPLGTVFDLLSPARSWKNHRKSPPEYWRLVKYILLFFLVLSAVFASQTFLFLDPMTILTRTLANSVWPALGYAVSQVEAFLYQFEFLWGILDAFHQSAVYPIFRNIQPVQLGCCSDLPLFCRNCGAELAG